MVNLELSFAKEITVNWQKNIIDNNIDIVFFIKILLLNQLFTSEKIFYFYIIFNCTWDSPPVRNK